VARWHEYLITDPLYAGGEPCARGTRVPVTVIPDNLAEGNSNEEILRSYPSLRKEHIDAALSYAADPAREERLIPLQTL
jgi:uncharacterized protein (DUF433 family)